MNKTFLYVKIKYTWSFLWLAVFAAVLLSSPLPAYDLLDYIKAPDNSFRWEKAEEANLPLGKKTVFAMTSQTWQGIQWKHKILLYTPTLCEYPETAVLIISGGMGENEIAMMLASMTKCPVAVLNSIPNQPLYDNLREDALIAYTFAKALETDDWTWPLLLPMTKGAVRAMDVLQTYSTQSMQKTIKGFVVGGASKRGWTTWLTAAVDPDRVAGIIPIVYDNLDLVRQMELQKVAYGEYSQEISEYTEIELQDKMLTEKGKYLVKVVDPWAYKDRITMPKLIINGANDPYWNVASMNIYWDALKGDNSVLYVPNGGHELGISEKDISSISRVVLPMTAFIQNVAKSDSFPALKWHFRSPIGKCRLDIKTSTANAGKMWVAYSDTRDFRNSKWNATAMNTDKSGYTLTIDLPKSGYMAVFGEVSYSGTLSYTLSTQVCIYNSRGMIPVLPAKRSTNN